MISEDRLIVLDTSVLVYLIRGKAAGRKINEDYQLDHRRERPLISVVTIGECLALAKRLGWESKRQARLEQIVRNLVVVEVNRPAVLREYAELHTYARTNGFTIGKNDLWIAATTAATNAALITCDKDFLPLQPSIRVHFVDPEQLPKGK